MINNNVRQVLGQCVGFGISPDAADALNILNSDMMHDYELRSVYEAIKKLQKNGVIVDIESVERLLPNDIGFSFLAELVKNTFKSSQVVAYANQAKKAHNSAVIAGELQLIANELITQGLNAQDFSQRLSVLAGNADFNCTDKEPVSMHELAKGYVEIFESRCSGEIKHAGLDIGINMPLNRTDLMIIGGNPGQGKTALMMYILGHIAERGVKSLIFSLEMEDMQLLEREVSKRGMISISDLKDPLCRTGEYDQQDAINAKVVKGVSEAMGLPIYIDDTPNLTLQSMKARCRKFKESHPDLGMITIDYLTLMDLPKSERRDLSIGEITRNAKLLAKELKTPIVVLSQMNRTAAKENREPENHDLRDSGSIEQDADKIIFPYRLIENAGQNEGLCKVLKRKVRDGEVGHETLEFRFGNMYQTERQWQDQKEDKEEPRKGKKYAG